MSVKPIPMEDLQAVCAKLSAPIPVHILPELKTYLELLIQWNKAMNLVGAKHWQECLEKLLIDSFYLAAFLKTLDIPDNPDTWDLGAGAGLPGIVLRMLWSEGKYYLVEAREKRALFLQTVLTRIKLNNTYVFQGRAEKFFAKSAQNPARMVVSRAFMPWKDVLHLVQDHIHPQAKILFLALEAAPKRELNKLGWEILAEQNYMVSTGTDTRTVAGTRTLWAVQKKSPAT